MQARRDFYPGGHETAAVHIGDTYLGRKQSRTHRDGIQRLGRPVTAQAEHRQVVDREHVELVAGLRRQSTTQTTEPTVIHADRQLVSRNRIVGVVDVRQ